MLGWLMNSEESHGLGDGFLKHPFSCDYRQLTSTIESMLRSMTLLDLATLKEIKKIF